MKTLMGGSRNRKKGGLVACEEAFYPAIVNRTEGGGFQRELPESVYGALIVAHLNQDLEKGKYPTALKLTIPVFSAWLTAVVLQLGFAVYLHEAVARTDGDGGQRRRCRQYVGHECQACVA